MTKMYVSDKVTMYSYVAIFTDSAHHNNMARKHCSNANDCITTNIINAPKFSDEYQGDVPRISNLEREALRTSSGRGPPQDRGAYQCSADLQNCSLYVRLCSESRGRGRSWYTGGSSASNWLRSIFKQSCDGHAPSAWLCFAQINRPLCMFTYLRSVYFIAIISIVTMY